MRAGVTSGVVVVLSVVQACAVSDHEDGIAIAVSLGHEPGGWPEGVVLERAYVAVTAIELVRCADEAAWTTRRGTWWGVGVGVAHAHGTGSPTRLGVPVVLDLLAGGDVRHEVGVLAAPPGRYCGVAITVGPADGDALGLAAAPAMQGKSTLLAGAAGDGRLDGACTTTVTASVELEPFEVSAERRQATLDLVIRTAGVLDAAALAAGDGAGVACAAAGNAARAVSRRGGS
jgi:hypothetical protein